MRMPFVDKTQQAQRFIVVLVYYKTIHRLSSACIHVVRCLSRPWRCCLTVDTFALLITLSIRV